METNESTTHAPRVVSTTNVPTVTLDAFGNDVRIAALIAEYGPIAAAKAAKDREAEKRLAAFKLKHGGGNAK